MDSNIKELIDTGREKFGARDFAAAEHYLTQVLAATREFADVHNMLGVIWHDQGQFGKAIDAFKEALALNPNYTEANLNLSVTYNDLGMYGQSRDVYSNAKDDAGPSEGEPDLFVRGKIANMHADIGDAYAAIAMHVEAIDEYEKALGLRPEFVDIRLRMANSLRECGFAERAIAELTRTVKEKPDFFSGRVALGLAYYSNGEPDRARKEWQIVVDQDPSDTRAHMYLRLVLDGPAKATSGKGTARKKTKKKSAPKTKKSSRTPAKRAKAAPPRKHR